MRLKNAQSAQFGNAPDAVNSTQGKLRTVLLLETFLSTGAAVKESFSLFGSSSAVLMNIMLKIEQ